MSCKHCIDSVIPSIDANLHEFEHVSSKPKKGFLCTIIPERPSVLKADEISSYCSDDEGYRRCNKKIND